jgi:hypothetical protein
MGRGHHRQLVNYVSEAIAFVVYPIYLRAYGETRDATALRPHLTRPTEFLSLFLPMVLGSAACFCTCRFFGSCRLRFRDRRVSFALRVGRSLVARHSCPVSISWPSTGRTRSFPIGLGAALFDYFFGRWMIDQGFGLRGVAGAMALGTFLHTTCVLSLAGWHSHRSRTGVMQWIARLYAPAAYFAGIVLPLALASPQNALGGAARRCARSSQALCFWRFRSPFSPFTRSARSF